MKRTEINANGCRLDAVLHFLLREEDETDQILREIEKVLDPFWDDVEALYPAVSRNDDSFFLLVTGLVVDIESASFKAGFLSGFSLAQEIDAEIKQKTDKNTHPFQ